MRELCILALLGWNSWTDIRKREISLWITLVFGAVGFILLFTGNGPAEGLAVRLALALGVLALSISTAGEAGMGDGILLLCLAGVTEVEEMVRMVLIGLVLCALWGLFLMVVRKKGRSYELPFVPFRFLGYAGGMLLCGNS